MKKPLRQKTKYEVLDELLAAYGMNRISDKEFWDTMRLRCFTQDDIDWYLEESRAGGGVVS